MFVNYLFTSVTTITSSQVLQQLLVHKCYNNYNPTPALSGTGSVALHVEHAEEETGRQAANMKRNKTIFDVRTSPTLPPPFC
jgi:hypothetical protein